MQKGKLIIQIIVPSFVFGLRLLHDSLIPAKNDSLPSSWDELHSSKEQNNVYSSVKQIYLYALFMGICYKLQKLNHRLTVNNIHCIVKIGIIIIEIKSW